MYEFFYEIYSDGLPTGMGSTCKEMAENMVQDYSMIYGGECILKEVTT